MRLERTTLGEITDFIEEVYLSDQYFLLIKLSAKRVRLLQLELNQHTVAQALCSYRLHVPLHIHDIQPLGHSVY